MKKNVRRIGTGDVQAHMLFIHANPNQLTNENVAKIFNKIFRSTRALTESGTLEEYVAFLEKSPHLVTYKGHHSDPIKGRIEWMPLQVVQDVLAVKKKHAATAYRNPGHVSTHPPKFLTSKTLIIVMGNRAFLLENLHLYLEDEGILRTKTFELLKVLANLDTIERKGSGFENFLYLIIKDKEWYSGNVEALGARSSEATFMSDADLISRLEIGSR